jgi:Thin aggregative fimbriae synthesis protein
MGVCIKVLLDFKLVKFLTNGFLLVIFLILSESNSYCQKPGYDINIENSLSGQHLIIEGTFKNNSESIVDASYHLTINKESKSGNSSTNQSGEIKVPVNRKISLSRSSLDLKRDAVYTIHLTVQSGKNILADKELKLNGSEIQKH